MCLGGGRVLDGTVFLQNERLTDLPSVTMNEFKTPSLNRALARRRRDEPSRGRGIDVRGGTGDIGPNQYRRPTTGFRGELQSSNFHPSEPLHHYRNHRPHASTSQ